MDGDRMISLNEQGLSRRNALKATATGAALGTTFALSVQPVQAQTMITTPADGLTAGVVKVKTRDGKEMDAYRAMPATGQAFATILVVQEIFGVHAHIADLCRRFAKAGYYAIAPELYFRQGDAKAVSDMQALLREIVSKVPDEQVMGDLDATVDFAKGEGKADTAKLGITGFCWGGRTTWMYAAHNPAVKAAVPWYGPVARSYFPGDKAALDMAGNVKAAVLALYGAADGGIPNDTVEKMVAAVKSAGNPKVELVLYPDTPHAFHADYRPSYRKEQAEDGWKRAVAWFRTHGVA